MATTTRKKAVTTTQKKHPTRSEQNKNEMNKKSGSTKNYIQF